MSMFGVDTQGLTHTIGTAAKCLSAISLRAKQAQDSLGTEVDSDNDNVFEHPIDDHQQAHNFLVGTCGLRLKNHFLQMIQYQNSDYNTSNELQALVNFRHSTGEVCAMGVADGHDGIVSTCGGSVSSTGDYTCRTKVWKLPETSDLVNTGDSRGRTVSELSSENRSDIDELYRSHPAGRITPSPTDEEKTQSNIATYELEEVLDLVHPTQSAVSRILWKPQTESAIVSNFSSGDLVTLGPDGLCLYDVNHASTSPVSQPNISGISYGCWNPHDLNTLSFGRNTDIKLLDLRSMKEAHSFEKCHRCSIRDIDYNPIRPHVIASGGEDGLCKFWDLRKMEKPIKIISGHSHWVSSVKYNRFHDQLFLSASTDGSTNLWRVSSISSSPYTELEGIDVIEDSVYSADSSYDMCILKSEHQESIYNVAWSMCDAWVYASLSFDGHVQVNFVPSQEKYKILL